MSTELAHTINALLTAVPELEAQALPETSRESIVKRGFFRPDENEAVAHWFARFLTQREALWAVINEVDASLDLPLRQLKSATHWRLFVLGYAAACLLVRQDRFLLQHFATESLIQRKLNEAFPEYRIPRKQYSAIFSGYTDPIAALQLYEAMGIAGNHRHTIEQLAGDPEVGRIVAQLDQLESHLDPSKRRYVKRLFQFISHRWRRRGASAKQQTMFAVLEGFGRTAARMNPPHEKHVTPTVLKQFSTLLRPGDVVVSRHRYALTNYLLPGTWPHASLYVGTPQQRDALGVAVDPAIGKRWADNKCTLEALRDGVLFRPLTDTLSVDYVAVLRPNLSSTAIREGLQRVVLHEGKAYNFDFDFFSSDRLVCTEVIYRAFDGIAGFKLPLTERAGRQTLSAEDLLDLALDTDKFKPIAVFGYPNHDAGVITGDPVSEILASSYRNT